MPDVVNNLILLKTHFECNMWNNIWFCFQETWIISIVFPFSFLCWQIAASYGSIVCVFEPVQHADQKDTSLTVSRLDYLPVTVWSCMYSKHPEKTRPFSFRPLDIWNRAEYCSSEPSRKSAGEKQIFQTHMHYWIIAWGFAVIFMFFSSTIVKQKFAVSYVSVEQPSFVREVKK